MAAILLSLLTNLARSAIIQKDLFGADTEDDYIVAGQMLLENDMEAFTKMVLSGRVHVFKKGDVVSLGGHGGTSGFLLQVRKMGELEYYLVDSRIVDNSPPGEEPSNNEANAATIPDIHNFAPRPKPTPVPATALSTPKGFNGEVTGIKLFLNQTPEVWIRYYGNNCSRENADFDYTWYVGRFKLYVSFDRKSHKADSVDLRAQPCKPFLTLDEAKKVVAPLGLKNLRQTYDADGGSWDHDNEAIYARYLGGESGDPRLSIQTSLYNEGFISD